MTDSPIKSPNFFYCKNCDYSTYNKKDYNRHLNTRKHADNDKMMTNDDKKPQKIPNACPCGKVYKYRQGLHVHKKTCNYQEGTQVIELAKLAGNNNDINSHNVNNKVKNKFNINMFLNEKCKDALNISDFVNQLNIGIKDLEETGRMGFADGISKIFINGLNQLDIHNKPIHCNDAKREVLYIKDSDKWVKEEDNKPILTKAIKEVAYKNIKQISEWQKIYPEYNNPDSKQNDKYLQIVSESMSGSSKEESEKNYNKIIRKLAKETVIPESEK
jgi:hypothetical protein